MADIKVSNLNDGVVDSSSYLLESNTNVSYKVKASDIGTFVNAAQADYSLNTTANTIVGAINEVATASGTTYDNTSSGLSATEVQSAVDEVNDKLDNLFEKKSNKVTSMSSSSTDEQYPSAKAVYDISNTFEKTSNKVTSISSSSTDEQYPSAKSVYGMLNVLLGGNGGDWKNTANGNMQWYFYEGADTVGYNLPTANCFVLLFKKTGARGVAFAFGWDGVSTNKTLWKNTLQDSWKGWVALHSN